MLKQKISNNLKPHLPYLAIFFIISLIPFYWLKNGLPVGYGDGGLNLFFDFAKQQIYSLYLWNSNVSTGVVTPSIQTCISLFSFGHIFESLGFGPSTIEALEFSFIIFFSLLFSYLLTLEISKYSRYSMRVSFFSALFYTLNPFILFNFWYGLRFSLWVIPFYPLVLFCIIKGYSELNKFYAMGLGVALGIFPLAFVNPVYAFPIFIPVIILFIFYFIKYRYKKLIFLKYNIFIIISFSLLGSYWLVPLFSTYLIQYNVATFALDPLEILKITSTKYINWSSLLRLTPSSEHGLWTWRDAEWKSVYYNPFFVLISYLFLIISMLPLFLVKHKQKGLILLFASIGFIGLFLSKGVLDPFGGLFSFLFLHVPFFNAFRDPLDKFGIISIIGITPLFGIGLNQIYISIKNLKLPSMGVISVVLVVLLVVGLFGAYNFIFWSGQIVNTPTGYDKATNIEVPDYYNEVNDYLGSEDFKIAAVPLKPLDHVSFNWEHGYSGADSSWLLYNHPTISYLDFALDDAAVLLQKSTENEKSLYKMAGLLNIKYIIIQHDIDLTNGNYGGETLISPADWKGLIAESNFEYVNTFGELDLYKISDQLFVPHIYPVSNATLAFGDRTTVTEILTSDRFIPGESVILLSDQLSSSQWQFVQSHNTTQNDIAIPNVDFLKINPAKYELIIKNATHPFYLVFSETYNPQWKAYVSSSGSTNWLQALFQKSIADEEHLKANGYANSWYIDPVELGSGKDFNITLYYKPQSSFYLGSIISAATFVICVGALFTYVLKRKKTALSLNKKD